MLIIDGEQQYLFHRQRPSRPSRSPRPALVSTEDSILSDLPAIRSGKPAALSAGFPDLVRKLLPP
jgi:hypothetical protein